MRQWQTMLMGALMVVGAHATAAGSTLVEFYHSELKHYFYTASPQEAAAVDAGAAGVGWARTGMSARVWGDNPDGGLVGACRFYALGPNSHFYTADASECGYLRALEADQRSAAAARGEGFLGWAFEGVAFYAAPATAGVCPGGTPMLRSYNEGGVAKNASNHRLTANESTHVFMINEGWADEGVVMCADGWSYEWVPGVATPDGGPGPGEMVRLSPQKFEGTYSGQANWERMVLDGSEGRAVNAPLTLTFDGQGRVSGAGNGCAIQGSEVVEQVLAMPGLPVVRHKLTLLLTGCLDAGFNGSVVLEALSKQLSARPAGMSIAGATAYSNVLLAVVSEVMERAP